jgi:hypothetical protein
MPFSQNKHILIVSLTLSTILPCHSDTYAATVKLSPIVKNQVRTQESIIVPNIGSPISFTNAYSDLAASRRASNVATPNGRRPEPTFKANRTLPISRLISRDRIEKSVPKEAQLLSTNLQTWGAYEDAEQSGANFSDISRDRMVWVLKTYHMTITTDDGTWDNATVTEVIDAETGRQVSQEIGGKMRDNGRFRGIPEGSATEFKRRPLPPTILK